jgi:hypothetical protein
VREDLGVESNFKLLMGLSFGYIDKADAANNFRTERAALNDTATFHR